jgi:hypothetical protein
MIMRPLGLGTQNNYWQRPATVYLTNHIKVMRQKARSISPDQSEEVLWKESLVKANSSCKVAQKKTASHFIGRGAPISEHLLVLERAEIG